MKTSHHGPKTSHHGPKTSHHGPKTSHHGPRLVIMAPRPIIMAPRRMVIMATAPNRAVIVAQRIPVFRPVFMMAPTFCADVSYSYSRSCGIAICIGYSDKNRTAVMVKSTLSPYGLCRVDRPKGAQSCLTP